LQNSAYRLLARAAHYSRAETGALTEPGPQGTPRGSGALPPIQQNFASVSSARLTSRRGTCNISQHAQKRLENATEWPYGDHSADDGILQVIEITEMVFTQTASSPEIG
jgi:hypothetical protein